MTKQQQELKKQQDAYEMQKKQAKRVMTEQVEELEMKARYWKAQWEVKHFTLENEKLQTEYDSWMEEQQKKNEEAMKKFQEQMEKNAQAGMENEKVPALTLDNDEEPVGKPPKVAGDYPVA